MPDLPPVICDRLVRLRHLYEAFKAAPDPSLAICRWLGMPHRTDCPTPGEARTWHKNEWHAWATKFGYTYHGDTAHNFMWTHPLTNLRVGLAKTSSDFRSPMALACQVRREIASFVAAVCQVFYSVPDPASDSEQEGKAAMVLCAPMDGIPDDASDDALRPMVCRAARMIDAMFDGPAEASGLSFKAVARVPVTQVMGLLQRIQRDYDWQPRRSLMALMGESRTGAEMQQSVERMLARLKIPGESVGASLLDGLEDLREVLREEDRVENERRKAERDARRKPAPEPSHRDRLQALMDQRKQAVLDQLHRVEQAAKSAVDRTMLAIQSLPSFDLPEDLTDPVMVRSLEGLQAKLDAEIARAEAAEAKANDWCERATMAEAASAQSQHTAQLRAHLQAFAGLVVDTVRGAANMNPFALVNSLNSLAQEAEAAIIFAKSTEPSAPTTAEPEAVSAAGSAA